MSLTPRELFEYSKKELVALAVQQPDNIIRTMKAEATWQRTVLAPNGATPGVVYFDTIADGCTNLPLECSFRVDVTLPGADGFDSTTVHAVNFGGHLFEIMRCVIKDTVYERVTFMEHQISIHTHGRYHSDYAVTESFGVDAFILHRQHSRRIGGNKYVGLPVQYLFQRAHDARALDVTAVAISGSGLTPTPAHVLVLPKGHRVEHQCSWGSLNVQGALPFFMEVATRAGMPELYANDFPSGRVVGCNVHPDAAGRLSYIPQFSRVGVEPLRMHADEDETWRTYLQECTTFACRTDLVNATFACGFLRKEKKVLRMLELLGKATTSALRRAADREPRGRMGRIDRLFEAEAAQAGCAVLLDRFLATRSARAEPVETPAWPVSVYARPAAFRPGDLASDQPALAMPASLAITQPATIKRTLLGVGSIDKGSKAAWRVATKAMVRMEEAIRTALSTDALLAHERGIDFLQRREAVIENLIASLNLLLTRTLGIFGCREADVSDKFASALRMAREVFREFEAPADSEQLVEHDMSAEIAKRQRRA